MRLGRQLLVLAAFVAGCVGLAVAYSALADDVYESHADLLVRPVGTDDPLFVGFTLFRVGEDRASPAATAARLAESPLVVDDVVRRLRLPSRDAAVDAVDVHAVDRSSIVTIEARAGEPARAAQIANGFADALVARRSERFQSELQQTIRRLRDELRPLPFRQRTSPEAVAVQRRLALLVPLLGAGDPTIKLAAAAVPADERVWPRPWATVAGATFVALAVGLLALLLAAALGGRRAPAPVPTTRELEGLRTRVRELEARLTERDPAASAAAAPEPELEPEPEPEPEPDPTPTRESKPAPSPAPTNGAYDITSLTALVTERRAEFPDRAGEWDSYLYFLRDHAAPDGTLPPRFDYLVAEVFDELLER